MAIIANSNKVKVGELLETHQLYDDNIANWNFLMASYEGTRQLLRLGYLKRHERESLENYERRLAEAYGFNYSRSIIDLFNFYLFKKPVKRDVSILAKDKLWNDFVEDCDLDNSLLDDFFVEAHKYASIYGSVGILVDSPEASFETKADQKEKGVYPYLSIYFPPAILDWDIDRDEYNRPYLSYLKLLDDRERYLLWWQDKFEVWVLPDPDDAGKIDVQTDAIRTIQKDNTIGVIPFTWLYNIKPRIKPIGMSDVEEVSRIDLSIMRNLSDGEEIITYASFPMMRKPMKEARPDGPLAAQGVDDVGITAVLEFDPEHPESKPDWLEAQVAGPLGAITTWIMNKVAEIYRSTNAGGMAAMEVSTAVKSGAALQAEFQLLNSALVRKAKSLESVEKQIIYYFLLWEDREEIYKDISVERARTYDVENLAADLENAMTAKLLVMSKKFKAAIQKLIARQMLPSFSDEQMKEIDDEIDEYEPPVGFTPPADDLPSEDGDED